MMIVPPLPLMIWAILAGVLGLIVGSFLNVVIVRLPQRLAWEWRQSARSTLALPATGDDDIPPPGLILTASHCPRCRHRLAAWENIPLLSWLVLRGRCHHCHTRISMQYPVVEALAAIIAVVVVLRFGITQHAVAGLLLSWLLIVLAAIDLRTRLLPDCLTYPLLWLGLAASLVPVWQTPAEAITGALTGYLSLWSVYWLFRLWTGTEGMGHGDFKLLAGIGAWLGAGALLPVVLMASLAGACWGGLMLSIRHHATTRAFAFGPFLAAAAWIWLIAGEQLWALYAHVVGII